MVKEGRFVTRANLKAQGMKRMTGDTWIIIGVLATALGAFALSYGFYRKSEERSEANVEMTGDHVEGDKIKAEGHYVAGDFIQIGNSFHSGSTGVFVNLVLNIADFVREGSAGDLASVDDYLKWRQEQRDQALGDAYANLPDLSRSGDDQSLLVRDYIETVIRLAENHRKSLKDIVEQTQLLPDMDSKLDYLVEQFSKNQLPGLHEGQLPISARVLDMLTTGVVGSGFKVMMKYEAIAREGTAMVVWLLGARSPHMMLLDLVGDVHTNRISIILNEDASISLRVYDAAGDKTEVKSKSCSPGDLLVILAIWKDLDISLWVNGESHGSASMSKAFDYLGPACLFGIDIEGKLSADAVRWSPKGEPVGLNFLKNGIWHGSRFDTVMLWGRVLDKSEIETLAEDTWVMFRDPEREN